MTLAAPRLDLGDVCDDLTGKPVLASQVIHRGMVWDLVSERVDLGEGGQVTREFVRHPGAVVVVALRGEPGAEEMAVIQQYRHPVRAREWELPAGLLDVAGEPPYEAAIRELAEEVDLRAARWDVLLDYVASPGGLDEALRIFLARDLTDVPADERHAREAEEVGMPTGWLSVDDAVTAVLTGRVYNVGLALGALATDAARRRGWSTLRPPDAPFPAHQSYRA